jgi:aminoglycoside phosphotransferase (APT) family kinase protein
LLALSASPDAVVALGVSSARLARRMITDVAVLGGLSVLVLGLAVLLVLGLAVLLVLGLGIPGGEIVQLAARGVTAIVMSIRGLAAGVLPRLVRSNQGGVPGRVVLAALAKANLTYEHALRTASDTAVILIRTRGASGVLKVAATASGVASLRREAEMLSLLRSDERLGALQSLLPVPWNAGYVNGSAFLVTSRLPGQVMQPEAARDCTFRAFDAIAPLHRLGRTIQIVDDSMLNRWVDEPAAQIAGIVDSNCGLNRLVTTLHEELAGRPVMLGWTHGDFYPGNVLATTSGRVSGIVDWSHAREADLVALDLMFWLLTLSARGQPRSFGARVAAELDRCWTPAESRLIGPVTPGPVSRRALVLLAWLRHSADNIGKCERYATSMLWSRRTITPVLRKVSGD